jgi:hypothetical protein
VDPLNREGPRREGPREDGPRGEVPHGKALGWKALDGLASRGESERTATGSPAVPELRLALGAALALGCALRLARPEVHSLWIDEGLTLLGAQSPDLVTFLRADSHPPLSYLVVRAWIALAGTSDLALRILPALVSCFSLALFAPLARAWLGERRGAWAVALYAASPLLVWLAHEVRMYAFVELATLATLHAGRAAWARPAAWRWSALAACVALATGLHYYGALAGLAVLAQAAVRRARGTLGGRALALSAVAASLGVAVWAPWLASVLPDQVANDWPRIVQTSPRDLLELPVRLLAVDLVVLREQGIDWLGWLLAFASTAGAGAFALRLGVRREVRAAEAASVEALLAALVPVAAALALAALGPGGFQPRYLVPAVPGAIACIAGGLAGLQPLLLARAASGLLLAGALALTLLQLSGNRREDYRSACDEVRERWQAGDRLLVIACVPPPDRLACVAHYLRDRPDVLAAAIDWEDYLRRGRRPPAGTRLHVILREATICWEPWDELRRTHVFAEAAESRFRIRRFLTQVPD